MYKDTELTALFLWVAEETFEANDTSQECDGSWIGDD
jgi:hypothetical protein